MENLGFHFTPLLFIPGVALIVLSTSNRLISLNTRILDIRFSSDGSRAEELILLEKRVFLFRKALISLYICIAFFALVTLLSCFNTGETFVPNWVMQGVMTVGVLFLFYAILVMVKESWIAIQNSKKP